MLTLAVAVEFFHRQLLAISVESIRADLGMNDTQMGGLLLAFAAAYFVMALVLGRLADRGSRRTIYALCIGAWSAATMAGAAVGSGVGLLLTRVGVGAGQAASGATNAPLVADYVAPERRATVMGFVGIGGTLGSVVGLAGGGYVVAEAGWRAAFAWGGGIGVAFALAFAWIVREPPRGWSEGRRDDGIAHPPMGEVLRTLGSFRTLPQLALGAILCSMAVMATAQWGPAFFLRVHGVSEAQAGLLTGVVALFATAGPVLGGIGTDRLWARRPRRAMQLPAWGCLIAAPIALLGLRVSNVYLATGLLALAIALALVHSAQVGAVPQALAPLRMRSAAAAIMNATLTAVGFGLGPFLTGWLSDLGGGEAAGLRFALTAAAGLYLWASLHFAWAARTIEAELPAGQNAEVR